MKPKPFVKAALLVFVFGSLAFLAFKESRWWMAPDHAAAQDQQPGAGVLVGMFLLDLFRFNFSTSLMGDALQARAKSWGTWGAGPLGMIFALS